MKKLILILTVSPLFTFGIEIKSRIFENLSIEVESENLLLKDDVDGVRLKTASNTLVYFFSEAEMPVVWQDDYNQNDEFLDLLSQMPKAFGVIRDKGKVFVIDFQNQRNEYIFRGEINQDGSASIYEDTLLIAQKNYSCLIQNNDTLLLGVTYVVPTSLDDYFSLIRHGGGELTIHTKDSGRLIQYNSNDPTPALTIAKSVLGDEVEAAHWASDSTDIAEFGIFGNPIWIKQNGKWSFGHMYENRYDEHLETEKGMYLETNVNSFVVNDKGIINLNCLEFNEACNPKQYLEEDDGEIFNAKGDHVAWHYSYFSLKGDSLIISTEVELYTDTVDTSMIEDRAMLENSMKIYNWRNGELLYSGERFENFGVVYLQEKNKNFMVFVKDDYYTTIPDYEILESNILSLYSAKKTEYFNRRGELVLTDVTGSIKYLKEDYYLESMEEDYLDVDENGNELTASSGNRIWSVSKGLIIDTTRYKNELWEVFNTAEGLFWFENQGLIGVVNMNGKEIYPAEILEIINIDEANTLFGIKTESGWGILNLKGEVLQNPGLSESEMIEKGRELMSDM